MKNFIQDYVKDSIQTKEKLLNNSELIYKIEVVAKTIIEAYKRGNKVMIAGNGGSAATRST